MTNNKTSDPLEQAVRALKAGDKTRSQQLLLPLLKADPRNERAWLCLAAAIDDPARKRECIQRALAINPASAAGRQMLTALDKAAMLAGTSAAPAAQSGSVGQSEGSSPRGAFRPENPGKPTTFHAATPAAQPETPTARVGAALSDGMLAGLISAALALIIPLIGLLSGNATSGSFYYVMGMAATLLLPLIGGLVSGYLYNRRRPNVNKNHFAVAGGFAGSLSGILAGLMIGMLLAFTDSEASVSLASSAGVTQYMLMCGLAPAVLGFGLGAVGAMLFGAFVPKSDSVHIADDPDSGWNRYKRASVRRSKSRAAGVVIAIVLIVLCGICQAITELF